jgi:anaerobic ribonucleoside-triphosphate reductase activating protein
MEAVTPWLFQADGITISGGEPFDQPQALRALLHDLRARSAVDILVYSGYSVEALEPMLLDMNGLIDALITDPYDHNAPQSLALRGSDNQRLHFLTEYGRTRLSAFERETSTTDKRFDLMMDEDATVWLAGIPARDDFGRLKHLLARDGHRAITTEDISARRRARIET